MKISIVLTTPKKIHDTNCENILRKFIDLTQIMKIIKIKFISDNEK